MFWQKCLGQINALLLGKKNRLDQTKVIGGPTSAFPKYYIVLIIWRLSYWVVGVWRLWLAGLITELVSEWVKGRWVTTVRWRWKGWIPTKISKKQRRDGEPGEQPLLLFPSRPLAPLHAVYLPPPHLPTSLPYRPPPPHLLLKLLQQGGTHSKPSNFNFAQQDFCSLFVKEEIRIWEINKLFVILLESYFWNCFDFWNLSPFKNKYLFIVYICIISYIDLMHNRY